MTTESHRAAAILDPRDRVIPERPAHQPTGGDSDGIWIVAVRRLSDAVVRPQEGPR